MAAVVARYGIDIDESSCVPLGDDVVGVSGGAGEVQEIIEVVVLPPRAEVEVLVNSFTGFSKRVYPYAEPKISPSALRGSGGSGSARCARMLSGVAPVSCISAIAHAHLYDSSFSPCSAS